MVRPPLSWTPLAAAVALVPLGAGAATGPATPDVVERVEEIRVYANPVRPSSDEVAQPVEVLYGEELARRVAPSLGETVAREPGIQTSYFGPAVGRPIVRGLAGPRVKVLENGIGVLDASVTSDDHAVAVEPFLADRIEILKGPATVLYGSGAIGGVVNTVSGRLPERLPDEPVSLRGELRGGDVADERTALLRMDGAAGGLVFHADGVVRETDPFEIPGSGESAARVAAEEAEHAGEEHEHEEEEAMRGVLENSDLDTESVSFGLGWIGEGWQMGASVNRFQTEYGLPGGHEHAHEHEEEEHEGEHEHEEEEEGDVRIDLDQTRYDVHLSVDDPLPGFTGLRVRGAWNDYRHVEVEPSGEIGTLFEIEAFEGRIEALNAPVAGFTGAVGLQLETKDFSATGEEAFVIPVEREAYALFVYETRPVGNGKLELGGRIERVEYDPSAGEDTSFDVGSLALGISRPLGTRAGVSLQADLAQRAPALEELYANGAHLATQTFEIGDVNLDEEQAANLSLTLEGNLERVNLRGSVYATQFRDFIYLQDLGFEEDGLPARQWTQADALFTGVEGEAVFSLVESAAGTLDLRATGDLVRAQLDDAPAGDNEELPRIPAARLGLGLEFVRGNLAGELGWTRWFDQDDVPVGALPTDGFDMVTAYLGYHLDFEASHLELFLRADNLLDEEARLATSFLKDQAPLPGRGFQGGLRFSF
ncbi:MAG: TonB-dependent receptor [Pseudomonadales bacterium]|jgi:iron complex outermembrane receptor protein|nr:TonB-dependent receptor [Pseudomonadales bacterium]